MVFGENSKGLTDMLTLTIILGVATLILAVMQYHTNNKNIKLEVQNELLESRMESMCEKLAEAHLPSVEEPLKIDDVVRAIRHAGYMPDRIENRIGFMAAGEQFYVEIGRLPSIFLIRTYTLTPGEWDIDLLKQAAHLMSDELLMVKATISEDADGANIQFFVGACDANYASFRDNLTRYMSLIEQGGVRVRELHNKLAEQKRYAAIGLNPFQSENQQEKKLLS